MPIDYSLQRFISPDFKRIVSKAIEFFDNTPVHKLPPEEAFEGVGVYGIYYSGSYSIYSTLADPAFKQPIYVGKAVPAGWRTSRSTSIGANLYSRLRQHAASVKYVSAHNEDTEKLELGDFACRFMILGNEEVDLIVPIEAELIRLHKPLWNTTIDGFGNHDPGKGRYNQALSGWDMLHPGRPWASKLTNTNTTLEKILEKIRNHKR